MKLMSHSRDAGYGVEVVGGWVDCCWVSLGPVDPGQAIFKAVSRRIWGNLSMW